MVSFRGAASLGVALLAQLPQCLAMPTTPNHGDVLSTRTSPNSNNVLFTRQDENTGENQDNNPDDNKDDDNDDKKPFWLRIMPLGASITAGNPWPPEDDSKNGYRKFLRDQLRFEGWEVNMVGNYNLGSMNDNDHEGVPGDTVDKVRKRAKGSCQYWLPNVILINAGTNDANEDDGADGIGSRMRSLIDDIFSEVPKAVVVLSTLLPKETHQDKVDDINNQYRELAEEYNVVHRNEEPEFKVILADMADGIITMDDIHDGTHPNVVGQKKMAAVWDWAIAQAFEKGWLSKPSDSGKFTDGDGSTTCKKEYGSGADDPRGGRQVLYGSADFIKGDGTYKHDSTHRTDSGGKWEGDYNEMRMFFAQLVNLEDVPKGEERDEAIFVTANGDRRSIWYELNKGDGTFDTKKNKMDIDRDCDVENMDWGDVNGDGLDDFICIGKDGDMYVSINQGGNPCSFKDIGVYKKSERGAKRQDVRLGDIDGDGRLDYCVIEGNGDIYCWRNGGLGQKAEYWQDMGVGKPIFSGKDMGDIKGVRFADINGDGRYDWMWMDERGKTTTYINQRGDSKSLIPKWLSAGVTHAGVDKQENTIDDDNQDRHRIQFARLYENEKTDYVYYVIGEHSDEELTSNAYWDVWQNKGSGGRYQPGDGIYFGDTTGTGVDDYIWINPDGVVHVFPNKNTVNDTDYYNTGAWDKSYELDTKLSRRALHVGDWDGDGKADIIGVRDRKTGALKVWLSRWNGKDNFNWKEENIVDSEKCNQGWGRLYYDHGAHFADITGSGRVDYLCMEKDGRTTAWLRDEDGEWSNAKQVKFSEKYDRANHKFADVDGDGKADLIWTDKFTGDGTVWYNKGQKKESDRGRLGGSLFEWDRGQKVYQGSSRGPNMYFPSLGGQGRADMLGTAPSSGEGWVWFNSCPAGGDDGPIEDPHLPDYEPNPIDPDDGDPEDHWFCGAQNAAIWTPDLWNKHNMGDWLLRRSQYYTGQDSQWPDNVDGVPRVIAQYNGEQEDDAFNWEGSCRSISDTCELDANDLLKDTCTKFPERAFSLWAMRNAARFIQRWLARLQESSQTASLWSADVAKTFMSMSPNQLEAQPSSWLTIMGGILTTWGGLAPEAATPLSAVTGLLSMGNGLTLMGVDSTTKDVRFDDFSDLQKKIGEMVLAADDALTAYFNDLFTNTPPQHDEGKGRQLADILADGTFASQDIGTGKDEITDGEMVRLIRASIISEAWNMQQMAVVKWKTDSKFVDMSGFNPCEKDGKKWGMDHAIECRDEKNYMILTLVDNDKAEVTNGQKKDVPNLGQDEDTLKEYDLSHAKVITAAERTQESTGKFQPRSMGAVSDRFKDIMAHPSGNTGDQLRDDLTFFNIPVCDLDSIDDLKGWCEYSVDFEDDMKACVVDFVSRNCVKMKIGDEEWPYDFEATHDHGGPWDD